MFAKIGIGVAVLLAAFLGIAAMQPADFAIARSTTIEAPAEQVFAQVNDFHAWENWSPWAKLDPSMKKSYEGPTSGEGASYSWSGNGKVGEGQLTNVSSESPKRIVVRLDFLRPMRATNMAEFKFEPQGTGTLVTWTMTGKNNLIAKAIHLVCSLEKLIGPDFEKGLAQLKATVESTKK